MIPSTPLRLLQLNSIKFLCFEIVLFQIVQDYIIRISFEIMLMNA